MSAAERPTTYAELADVITNLGLIVRERRRADGLSQRAAARQIDVSNSTISRLESGEHLDGRNLAAVLHWLDRGGPR